MLRIGLTGGIGSGKTTVADNFAALGIDIIDADEIVHKLSRPGEPVFTAIVAAFGESILNADGTLDRKRLGEIVFSDSEARSKLEKIIHPVVRRRMNEEITRVSSPYCILVIPLLVETGFTDLVDRILVVTADEQRRIQWLKARDGFRAEQVRSIMQAQASDEERDRLADDIIENSGSIEQLLRKTEELDRKYRQLSAGR
jgi:dephospho-CoA kinase